MTIRRIMTATLMSLGTLPSLVCASMMANKDSRGPSAKEETREKTQDYTSCAETVEPGNSLPCCVPAVYPQFAGVELSEGPRLFGTGEFLWWTNIQETSMIAYINENDPANTQKEVFAHGGYRPGFKVGIGAEFRNVDQWVGYLEYTRFHHEWTNHVSARGAQTITPSALSFIHFAPIFFPVAYTDLKYKLTYKIDNIDVLLERPVYLGKRVIMNVFSGLQALFYEKKVSYRANGTSPFIPTVSQDSENSEIGRASCRERV